MKHEEQLTCEFASLSTFLVHGNFPFLFLEDEIIEVEVSLSDSYSSPLELVRDPS